LFALSLKNFNYPDYNGQHFVENAYASTITWFETGFSFGYMYKWTDDETIDLGINVKRLIGYNATDVALSKFDFIYNKKQDISINEVQGEYRMTQPAWGVGKGWGMDIGFNYQKKLGSISGYRPNTKADGCRHIDYKYKIGFSVLDVGAFKVTQNAILQEFDYKNQPFKFDSSQIKSFKDADNYIHTNLVNNGVQQVRGSSYRAWLPFALSAQFDYNFENNWFLNLTAVNSFKISDQTKRIDVFAVTPRYERKYFEVDFPVSLVDFRYPQMGIAFRFGNNFIIGTNRISSVTGKIRDTYGGSIYFNLKIAFYRKCGSKSSKKRYKQGKRPSCPAYAWVDTVGNKKGWGRI
ncbi:MAG: hypothetical protein IT235_01310, partial [Bacteroidia bacterium]|nr:hypothetical protein [Bacteroidia bacterium]